MLAYELGLLFALMPVVSFAPGFFFVRKLRWNPMEKLCGSIGLSMILIYLASWVIYCVGPRGQGMPIHRALFAGLSLASLALGAWCWKDAARLFRSSAVRRALAGLAFLMVWTALLMAMIRNYSGGTWYADWLEHFQRSLFFLHHFPAFVTILPGYALPSRPPMMNVLAAFFLAQSTDRFELFQAIFAFFNALLFLPCCLMMPALGRRAKRRTWCLALLFASSPLIVQNTTYTWTKAPAAFYIVLALWFYLAGWRKQDRVRITASFIALAAALLVHYSAGPYVVILTLHYLFRVFPRRPARWRELAGITAVCGALFGSWLIWSLAVYGPRLTFASNSTVTASRKYDGSTIEKMAANLFDTVVPAALRDPSQFDAFSQQRTDGAVRDYFFLLYQPNVIFGMGLVGGPGAVWLLLRGLRRTRSRSDEPVKTGAKRRAPPSKPAVRGATPEQNFWRILIAAGVVLGVAVVGERDPLGVAHLTLLSLQALGLTMIEAVAPWQRRPVAILLIAGCTLDLCAGVLLQAHVEHLENTVRQTIYPNLAFRDGNIGPPPFGPETLSSAAWSNWFAKHQLSAYEASVRELIPKFGADPTFQAALPDFEKTVDRALAADAEWFQGWFRLHGGEVTLVGDQIAAASALSETGCLVLLALLYLGLASAVYRSTR